MTVKLNDKFLSNMTGKHILKTIEVKNKDFFVVQVEDTKKRLFCSSKNNLLSICSAMAIPEDKYLRKIQETK